MEIAQKRGCWMPKQIDLTQTPTPFLKWAGGKRALVKQILAHVPSSIEHYYEPFLGAGSLFFSLPANLPKTVSDSNNELISVYEALRDDVDAVLRELHTMTNTREDYLAIRAWDRVPEFARRTSASRAARFIFLNKCGFNGLYRVNSKGEYNVPYGNPKTVDFISESNLRAVSGFLNSRFSSGQLATTIKSGDYKECLAQADGPGSLVYFDPPYHPISPTSNFTSYQSDGFGEKEQIELRDEVFRLTNKGARVLLSNSDTRFIRELYEDSIFTLNVVDVRRAIAAKSSSRGLITEVLIDNFNVVGSRQ
jgi:DNA adenine methylase